MRNSFKLHGRSGLFTVGAAILVLAGCGGSQAQPNPAAQFNVQRPVVVGSAANNGVNAACSDGPLKLSPCSVHFRRKDHAPIAVSVKYPGDRHGTLTERNNCRHKAKVQGSGSAWTVSRGREGGSCTAVFKYSNGHVTFTANLEIRDSRHRRHHRKAD